MPGESISNPLVDWRFAIVTNPSVVYIDSIIALIWPLEVPAVVAGAGHGS